MKYFYRARVSSDYGEKHYVFCTKESSQIMEHEIKEWVNQTPGLISSTVCSISEVEYKNSLYEGCIDGNKITYLEGFIDYDKPEEIKDKNSSSITKTDNNYYLNNTNSYSGNNSSLSIIEKIVLQKEIEELDRKEQRLQKELEDLETQIKENELKLIYKEQKQAAREIVKKSKDYHYELAGLDIYKLLVILNKAVCYVSSFKGVAFNSKLDRLGYTFERYTDLISKEIQSKPDFLFSDFFNIEIDEERGHIHVISLFLSMDIPMHERRQSVDFHRYEICYVYGGIGNFHVYSEKDDSEYWFNFHKSKEEALILNTSLQSYFNYREKSDYGIKECFDFLRHLFSGKEEEYGLHNINDFEKCLKKDLEILSNKYIENEKRKKRISKVFRIAKVSIIGLFIFSIFISIKLAFH